MSLPDTKLALTNFIQFREKQLSLQMEERQEELLTLEQIEELVKDILKDIEKDVNLSDKIEKLLNLIEEFADNAEMGISELDSELQEVYYEMQEFEKTYGQSNAPTPYNEA